MQWQLSPWHGLHRGPWHSWHCGPWQPGCLQSWPMQEVEPPLQLALAKPPAATALPQTFTGTLTGAVTVLPETIGMLKFPVVLPLSLPLPTLEIVECDPPLQPEFAKPPTAPETPHTFTGALIGAVTVLPEPSEMLRLPVTLPLWLWSPTPATVEPDPPAQPASAKP